MAEGSGGVGPHPPLLGAPAVATAVVTTVSSRISRRSDAAGPLGLTPRGEEDRGLSPRAAPRSCKGLRGDTWYGPRGETAPRGEIPPRGEVPPRGEIPPRGDIPPRGERPPRGGLSPPRFGECLGLPQSSDPRGDRDLRRGKYPARGLPIIPRRGDRGGLLERLRRPRRSPPRRDPGRPQPDVSESRNPRAGVPCAVLRGGGDQKDLRPRAAWHKLIRKPVGLRMRATLVSAKRSRTRSACSGWRRIR